MHKSRTTISIEGLQGPVVHAYIHSWNPYLPVEIPRSLIPSALHGHFRPEARLSAQVNLAANASDELDLSDFEMGESAPDFF